MPWPMQHHEAAPLAAAVPVVAVPASVQQPACLPVHATMNHCWHTVAAAAAADVCVALWPVASLEKQENSLAHVTMQCGVAMGELR